MTMDAAAAAMWLFAEKCVREPTGWPDWRRSTWADALLDAGATSVVLGELTPSPAPGMPGVGFSHLTLARFADVPVTTPAAFLTAQRRRGALHGAHTTVDAVALRSHGTAPAAATPPQNMSGAILAWVMPNDPDDLAAWDRWYDEVHLPDMMGSGAFAAGSRWRRAPLHAVGANHLTLYDVAAGPVDDAVKRSAAAMPAIIAAGRKRRSHVGALTMVIDVSEVMTRSRG